MPLTGKVVGELVAVLTTLTLPETLPVAVGANLTASERLWPEARVATPEKPLTLNPGPAAVTCEMLTDPVPLLVTVNGNEPVVPTA